ncbi:HAD-superfamily hydrolase, subfamily IIA containing protein [Trichomonas vaginalis G3]|uniref:HAD-superfamily hydrolase, subfamily IIA containing protein n=1 Tax=Trichomonas vaginalis (strain ATCC PRA-98 / G3) TaxID=412133 RepID=A2G5V6_TRIV3|nr:phosphoglycolate phosphatase protein [Trichomonas vaginalis G3]EAX87460.1 HAD-superfamily hydrolase, subfamily IIA containing protein [Trichomonas vaginalis G3]KAI5537587.1 phosphoglycolate phosphatase protein [Trichomonas vaginalis G3]|eukprot:XP_001300390.1 HAD-superfamily hydrolase, subfamily IIA containing protein [Trichomonas vaginalis G3]
MTIIPKAILLDVDGTIWKAGTVFPGVPEAISEMRKMGLAVIILSNNSSRDRAHFAKVLSDKGIANLSKNDVFTAGYTCALKMKEDGIRSALVYGFVGLKEELDHIGIQTYTFKTLNEIRHLDAIAVCNNLTFDYDHLCRIATIVKKYDCKIYGANPDTSNIVAGKTICGAGSMVATIATLAGKLEANLGKPSPELIPILESNLKIAKEEMIMVGDRIPTDIEFGARNGLKTIFVLTGVDRNTKIESLDPAIRPTYILPSLADVPSLLKEEFFKNAKPNIQKPVTPKLGGPKSKIQFTNQQLQR